jgi:hypothetical protein
MEKRNISVRMLITPTNSQRENCDDQVLENPVGSCRYLSRMRDLPDVGICQMWCRSMVVVDDSEELQARLRQQPMP